MQRLAGDGDRIECIMITYLCHQAIELLLSKPDAVKPLRVWSKRSLAVNAGIIASLYSVAQMRYPMPCRKRSAPSHSGPQKPSAQLRPTQTRHFGLPVLVHRLIGITAIIRIHVIERQLLACRYVFIRKERQIIDEEVVLVVADGMHLHIRLTAMV